MHNDSDDSIPSFHDEYLEETPPAGFPHYHGRYVYPLKPRRFDNNVTSWNRHFSLAFVPRSMLSDVDYAWWLLKYGKRLQIVPETYMGPGHDGEDYGVPEETFPYPSDENLVCVGIKDKFVFVKKPGEEVVYKLWSRWVIIRRYNSEFEVDNSISRFVRKQLHEIESTQKWKTLFARGRLMRTNFDHDIDSTDSD